MHIGIFGQTESGKSTVAKRIINEIRTAYGMKVILLDPIGDPTYNADFMTSDNSEFLEVVFASKDCLLVVDESGESVGHYNKEMFKLATRSRHCGHSCLFICQRAKQIHPTVRNNCGAVYVFNQSAADCRELANDFNEPRILEASGFGAGEYLYKLRMKEAQKFKLF